MKEINGFRYSQGSFKGYSHRMLFTFTTIEGDYNCQVYTTNPCREDAVADVEAISNDATLRLICNKWTTAKQDELSNKIIDEMIKEI